MKKYLFAFGLVYKDIVKPVTLCTSLIHVYFEGSINGFEDSIRNQKKSFGANVLNMARSAVVGALIGVTFPVSVPVSVLYIQYTSYDPK